MIKSTYGLYGIGSGGWELKNKQEPKPEPETKRPPMKPFMEKMTWGAWRVGVVCGSGTTSRSYQFEREALEYFGRLNEAVERGDRKAVFHEGLMK